MDKFITRTPTWKTKSYTTVSSGYRRKSLGVKATPIQELNPKNTVKKSVLVGVLKPLQEQKIDLNSSRRLSIRDDRLLKIFASQPDQPLVVSEANASDSGCSSSSETFQCAGGEIELQQLLIDTAENTPPHIIGKLESNLNEPTDSSQVASTQQQQSKVLSDNDKVEEELLPCTPENALLATEPDLQKTPCADNWLIMRIQRDLNSPSASVRVRALKAMKSPTKSAYQQFDVPHAEQSLITAEDRRSPKPPKSIQELMEHIIVYVEVRTGEDNRSAGVKKVISALGAKVNDKLLRDTTHVIFKDGLLSTYKKAKNWNIPVVSILWIEACKTRRKICEPSEFPISNIDRYENPELYEKMKRHKSMQPDSEANKRVRVRATTPKSATPKIATPTNTGAVKKTSTLIDDTPTTSARKNKKTDISRFFTQLGINKKFSKNFGDWSPCETPATPANSATGFAEESPATVLLNRINDNDFCTPLQVASNKVNPKEFIINAADGPQQIVDAKKSLNFVMASLEKTPTKPKRMSVRRHSKMLTPTSLESTKKDVPAEDMSTSQTPNKNTNKAKTPSKNTRRSSIHIETRINISNEMESHDAADKRTTTFQNDFMPIEEEAVEANVKKSNATESTPKRSYKRRQTTYTPRPLEITTGKQITEVFRNQKDSPQQPAVVSSRPAAKRRTLFTPNKIDQSVSDDALNRQKTTSKEKLDPIYNNKLRSPSSDTQLCSVATLTALASFSGDIVSSTRCQDNSIAPQTPPLQIGSLLEQHSASLSFSSTRAPGRRRTLFDVSMDIITQRLHNINQISRRSIARPSNNDLETQRNPLELELTNDRAPVETVSSPNLSTQKEQTDHVLKIVHSTKKKLTDFNAVLKEADSSEDCTEPAPKKKRKLFVPNEICVGTTPTRVASTTAIESSNNSTSNVSRRRTLMPLSQPQSESKPATKILKTTRAPRRSTMDFEDMRKVKNSLAKKLQATDKGKAIGSTAILKAAVSEVTKPLQSQPQPPSKHVDAAPIVEQKPQGPFLVYTNMHREQIEVIKEALAKLGHFQLEDNVTAITTHIVSLEPRRTLNLLRALLRGLWILDYAWILDSLRAGKWLNEEHYELRDFSRAVQICRSERQAFGITYKSELFSGLGAFYVSSRCGFIPKEYLQELIQLSGGKIADQRKRAKYILGDINRSHEDKVYITPAWILDSITHMQLQKLTRYASGTVINLATTSQQPTSKPQNVQNSQNNCGPRSQV